MCKLTKLYYFKTHIEVQYEKKVLFYIIICSGSFYFVSYPVHINEKYLKNCLNLDFKQTRPHFINNLNTNFDHPKCFFLFACNSFYFYTGT